MPNSIDKKAVPIMVAPNGARRSKVDHSAIPVTIDETVQCALECKEVGAHALHAHVRDTNQKHLLNADAYSELLHKSSTILGQDFPVQITTEAFGIYSTAEQIALVKTLRPSFASMAMREIIRNDEEKVSDGEKIAAEFYHWCLKENVGVQHILYEANELDTFLNYQERGIIPAQQNAILMVVGRYTESVVADTEDCAAVVKQLSAMSNPWMLCAFGKTETLCLQQTARVGGGVRVGFENSLENANGEQAVSNVERVQEVHAAIGNNKGQPLDSDQLYRLLGGL